MNTKSSQVSLPISPLHESYENFIQRAIYDNGFAILNIEPAHTAALTTLPKIEFHKDPFDRLLIAQAIVEGISIVTTDKNFAYYPIATVW